VSAEKRKLAARPGWPGTTAALWKFPGTFAAWYGDHFGLRARLIRWHALAMYRVFRQSPSDKVLLGRDGWLFYADDSSLEDYRSAVPFTTAELERWRSVMETRQDWLARRGARLVIVLACDKYIIYPEYLPAAYRRQGTAYRVDQLADYLAQHSRLTVVSLRQPLEAGKEADRLYHRTDTHWNDRGAYLGYRAMLQAAGVEPLPPTAFRPVDRITAGWDLARMMGLDDVIAEQDRALEPHTPRRARVVEVDRPDPLWNNGRVVLEVDDPKLPRLVVFRDSFGSALVPLLAENFRRSVFLWQYELDVPALEQERPDVVIWLMTSRRLQWFIPANPPLP
jgi:hypothetical protein